MRNALTARWRALRPYSFTATIVPIACAFILVYKQTSRFSFTAFGLMLLCALLLHSSANLLNDYYDHVLGFDAEDAAGSSRVIQNGLLPAGQVRMWGWCCLALGIMAGLALAMLRGMPLLWMGVPAVVGAFFYSHPRGYKYIGLGESFVFLLMGPLLFSAAVFAAARRFVDGTVFMALPFGCMVTAIMLVNNIRDMKMDSAAGFATLPVRLGMDAAKCLYCLLLILAYVSPFAAALGEYTGYGVLACELSLPVAFRTARKVVLARHPADDLPCAPQETAKLYLMFGLLLAAGLMVGA